MSSTDSSGQPVLTEDELRRFSEFLHARTGMWFGEAKRYYIERRLHDRLSMTRSLSFANYFTLLRSDPAEESAVINSFTVNETYFYREQHQLKMHDRVHFCPKSSAAADRAIKYASGRNLARPARKPIRSPSGCSKTGAWSTAYNVEIVGSDIDTNALKMAVAGRFGSARWASCRPMCARHTSPPPDRTIRYHSRPARIRHLHHGQSDRPGFDGGAGPVRHYFLPECADLFQR